MKKKQYVCLVFYFNNWIKIKIFSIFFQADKFTIGLGRLDRVKIYLESESDEISTSNETLSDSDRSESLNYETRFWNYFLENFNFNSAKLEVLKSLVY